MITVPKDDIPPGEGKYYPGELGKTHGVAVFRRADGSFIALSADCPHRHCDVDWDAARKRWACPCHGSAFSADGGVEHGPAVDDLRTLPHTDAGDAITVEPV